MAVLAIAFLYHENFSLTTTYYTLVDETIPSGFNDFRIVQLSDLHNTGFGVNQRDLLRKIDEAHPDIIVITGDLVDRYVTNVDLAMDLVEGAIKIAPVYYVGGNHEARLEDPEEFFKKLEAGGVTILHDKRIALKRGGSSIDLLGLSEPIFGLAYEGTSDLRETLRRLTETTTTFTILLSHHSENLDIIADYQIDLVFSGHAHGGQVRIPFLMDGLIAPDQGFFPKFTSGIYQDRNTKEIVSRGLGNSILPFRVFNRPELVVVTLNPRK
ncbi:MAG: metallophosphoesterase [Erysipelotrichaceae bacterium]|nr:metallophosphoesterase [Erysipelotrichaceae bacterium]